MSDPDVTAVTLRPTRLERAGAVLSLSFSAVLIWVFAVVQVPLWTWVVVVLAVLAAVWSTWSVLVSRVELRGPTLVARNAVRTWRLTRPDVVDVVDTADRLARQRRIAGLVLTSGRVLRLTGARWNRSARPLWEWMDFHGAALGPFGPEPPDRGAGRPGWSGPVVR